MAPPSTHPGPAQCSTPPPTPSWACLPWIESCLGPLCLIPGDQGLAGTGEAGVSAGNEAGWGVLVEWSRYPGRQRGRRCSAWFCCTPPLRGTQEQSPPSRGCSAVRSVCAGSWGGTPGLCRANWKESGTARSQQLEGLSRQCPGSWPYPWRPTQQEEGSCTTERLFAQTHSQGPKGTGKRCCCELPGRERQGWEEEGSVRKRRKEKEERKEKHIKRPGKTQGSIGKEMPPQCTTSRETLLG